MSGCPLCGVTMRLHGDSGDCAEAEVRLATLRRLESLFVETWLGPEDLAS